MSFLKEDLKNSTMDSNKSKKKIKNVSTSIFLLMILGILIGYAAVRNNVGSIQDQLFCAFTEDLFCREIASDSISLHYTLKNPENYGIEEVQATLGNISTDPTEVCAALENVRSSLKHFQREELSVENQLTYDVLEYYLDQSEESAQYLLYEEPLGIVSGIQTQLPVVLSEYSFYNRDDVDTYLELMQTTPEYFASLIQFEEEKSEAGLFMSDRAADQVIEQCEAFMEMGENNYLISTFVERVNALSDLNMQEKSDYMQKNAAVLEDYILPAYESLVSAIEALKGTGVNTGGLCEFEDGKEYYEQLVQSKVGSERTVYEMKEMTKNQIIDDLVAMEDVLNSANRAEGTDASDGAAHEEEVSEDVAQGADESESVQQGTEVMDTVEIMSQAVYTQEVSSMETPNPITILNMLEEKIANAFPMPPQTAVSVKYVAKEMEEHLSPAFYMIPAIDNYSENVIYVNQAQMGDAMTLFTTLAHEGYPGHLYQTVYFAETNPDPVRNIFDFGGYVEGWATYAEMCSYYLAPVEKAQAKLLQKYSSVILGVYTLADIGIHYEGWNREDTLAFFSAYGISDGETVDHIYDLIIGSPGNYLKYYVGYLEFMELKKQWIAKKGNEFSQVEFHEAVLKVGPAPFEIVEEYMWEM